MEKRRARAVLHGDEVERAGPRVVPGKYNPYEANPVAGTGSAGTAPASDLHVGIAAWSISPGGTARAAPTVGAGCWPWGASPSPSPRRGRLLPRLSSQSWPNSDFLDGQEHGELPSKQSPGAGLATLLALMRFLSLSLLFAKGLSANNPRNENTDKRCSAKCFVAFWGIIYANCCS